MNEDRYNEILQTLRKPEYSPILAPNPTTLGPRYIAEKISQILEAKTHINSLLEEVEIEHTHAQLELNNLEEVRETLHSTALLTLTEEEAHGLDSKGRMLKAQLKAETKFRELYAERFPGRSLANVITEWKGKVHLLKTLMNIASRRRDDLTRLDSGVRLQHETIKTETTLYPRGGLINPSKGNKSTFPPPAPDDSVGSENSSDLVGQEDFESFLNTDSSTPT